MSQSKPGFLTPQCGTLAFTLPALAVKVSHLYLPSCLHSLLSFLAQLTLSAGGCIDYTNIQYGAQLNFAAFGMNAGHDGQTGFDFFLNHPEVITDFGYRSLHIEALVGKAVTQAYYGKKAKYNYYNGCSTGGRQGFGNAPNYPDDFDGMLLGSPGIDWLHIVSSKGILAHRIGWPNLNSSAYVRPEQWPAIVAAIVAFLDPMDGVTDGIIDEPTRLRFDPAILGCGLGVLNASMCLTPPQIQSVRSAYEPIADTAGVIVYPSFELGSDTSVFSQNQLNGQPQLSYTILQDYWRGAVYNSSTWTPLSFNETDMDFAVSINPGRVNVGETDLSTFYAHGHKIISYHGRNDPTVTSGLSERYFAGVAQSVNLTIDEMHSFYRLFFLPGMHHCSGGPGAWDVGQTFPLDGVTSKEDHNVLLSLVEWVEGGNAPGYVVGTKYMGDNSSLPVLAQRSKLLILFEMLGKRMIMLTMMTAHCVYPNVSRWDGVGNTTLASSWNCVAPGMFNYY